MEVGPLGKLETKKRLNPSRFAVFWRERVGIEPTGDATRLPLGFEDRGGHQHPIRSHISRMVIRFSA